MKSSVQYLFCLSLWAWLSTIGVFAATIIDANRLSESGRQEESIRIYRELISQGKDSSEVRYNLGTALLRAGRLGESLAQLRIAEQGMPRDSGVRTNLAMVRMRLESAKGGRRAWLEPEGWRWFTGRELGFLAVLGSLVAAVLFIWSWRSPMLNRGLAPYRWVVGSFAALLAGFFLLRWYSENYRRHAVIISAVHARHGPLADAPVAFRLGEGAEVRTGASFDDFVQVKDPVAGSWGWVPRREVVRVPYW